MVTGVAHLPPPIEYTEPLPKDLVRKPIRSWITYSQVAAASAVCITTTALQAINFREWGENPTMRTVLPFVGGVALQHALQTGLPTKYSDAEKSFFADYASSIFLTVSQVDLNVNFSDKWNEAIFGSLTGLGGVVAAAFVHTLITRRIRSVPREAPLLDATGSSGTRLPVLFFGSHSYRTARAALKAIAGGLAIGIGAHYKISLLRDAGMMVAGEAVGEGVSELCWSALRSKPGGRGYLSVLSGGDVSATPTSFKHYRRGAKVIQILAHTIPGPLFVLAGATNNIWAIAVCNIAIGVLNGGRGHLDELRFSHTPKDKLQEIKKEYSPLTKWEGRFKKLKWGFAGIVAAYGILSIAGLDNETGKFTKENVFDRTAMAAFLIFTFGSYFVSKSINKSFEQNKESKLFNSAYFYTNYSRGMPRIALFILERMRIGDKTLKRDPNWAAILGVLAYASLGNAIGNDAQSRGDWPHPRVFSSLTGALIFKFIAAEWLREVPV